VLLHTAKQPKQINERATEGTNQIWYTQTLGFRARCAHIFFTLALQTNPTSRNTPR